MLPNSDEILRTIFFSENAATGLPDAQQEFFAEVIDGDGPFAGARVPITNPVDFRAPLNLVIGDATPERRFIRGLTSRDNASCIDAWLKNTAMQFYTIEYAWKKGEHPKRGEFSPDFFIKQAEYVFVVEIKDDAEINDSAPENVKKHEYASAHFAMLNEWLKRERIKRYYQFTMLTPRNFNVFFQKLRERDLAGFASELDVAIRGVAANGK